MNIVLAGPTGLFREGVERILRDFGDASDVSCIDSVTQALPRNRVPDVLVIDDDCVREASATIAAARRHMQATPIVVLLTAVDRRNVDELIAAGAAGCLEKTASSDLLFDALRLVIAGGMYLPRALLAETVSEPVALPGAAMRHDMAVPEGHLHLTHRQIEVLALLARGRSNKAIARELNVAEATVKAHLTTIYKVLNVSSRSQASAVAFRMRKILDEQVTKALDGQLSIGRLFANMTSRHFRAGDVLFHKGDPSDALYYVVQGTVRLAEIGIEVGPGTLLGEIGLFSPEHRRTSTARFQTDSELLSVTATDVMRLYYQEPEFALYLIQLLARRLEADKARRS